MSEKRPAARRWDRLLGVGFILALLGAIEILVATGRIDPAFVPPPSDVAAALWKVMSTGAFAEPLGRTLYLLFAGYIAACLLGVVVGLLMGRFRAVYDLLEPLVEILRPLPKPALLPPLMLFLGLGDAMKITIIALAVFFPVVINTIQGVLGVDRVLIDVGRTFGHGASRILFRIVLPAATPMIMAGMRVGLGLGIILVVLAEMLAGTGGIGYLIIDMQRSFRIVDMYAWLVILAVVGYMLNAGFVALERRIVIW